jgi:hypothetical protein
VSKAEPWPLHPLLEESPRGPRLWRLLGGLLCALGVLPGLVMIAAEGHGHRASQEAAGRAAQQYLLRQSVLLQELGEPVILGANPNSVRLVGDHWIVEFRARGGRRAALATVSLFDDDGHLTAVDLLIDGKRAKRN